MTINIPSTFSTSDITLGDGVAAGQKITEGSFTTITDNHNFIGWNYLPTVGEVLMIRGGGFTTFGTGTSWYTLTGIPVTQERDGRGLQFTGIFTNSGGVDADIRLVCKSNTGSAQTLSAGATAVTLTLDCATPTAGDFVAAVQVKVNTGTAETVKLLSGTFHWKGQTGSYSGNPSSSGYVWADADEHQDTYPLTVEQVNRYLNGPYTAWRAVPQTAGGVHWGWTYRFPSTTSTSYSEITRFQLVKRRPTMALEFCALGLNGTLKIEVNGTEYEIALSSGVMPAYNASISSINVHKFSSIDVSEGPQILDIVISWKSTSGSAASLFSVNAMVDK
jgi:hypothetical protein